MTAESLKTGDGRQSEQPKKVCNGQPATGNGQRAAPLRAGSSIADRLLDFGASAIQLSSRLPRLPVGRHLALQLARSATSAGANYEEARAAEGINDFVHKLSIAAKEMREASYWVRLIERAAFCLGDVSAIVREAGELNALLGASVRTARARQAKQERG